MSLSALLKVYDEFLIDLCEVWAHLSIGDVMWNYMFFIGMLGDHVYYGYVFICVVLGLMHGCSYLIIWVYNVYFEDYMVSYRMTYIWQWLSLSGLNNDM